MYSCIRIFSILALLAFSGIGLAACGDTMQGFGQDMEDIGDDIQNETN